MWPLLLNQGAPSSLPSVPYVELSSRWDNAPIIETGLTHLLAVAVCPGSDSTASHLVAIDSTGEIAEFEFDGTSWHKSRGFSMHQPITAACAGMPEHDRIWRLYLGTRSGHVVELTRGDLGWTANEFYQVQGPVAAIYANKPGYYGVSQMFVIDAKGHVTNLWIAVDGKTWIPRDMPDLPGRTVNLCFDYGRLGVQTVAADDAGHIYKFTQDSLGYWTGTEWANLPAGPLDMAPSADPSGKDVAVYYSGADGVFRYLFENHKTDDVSRIPIAAGTTHMLGKDDQLRFNEFFGLDGVEYCLFEFNFETRVWDRIPMKKISEPITSVTFGPARDGHLCQIFVGTANGQIHEFVRQKLKTDSEDN